MNRLKIIFNLIIGKNIIIYNEWTRDVLMIIGDDEEVIQNRYYYDFISHSNFCLKDIKGKIKYIKGVDGNE